ncbi:ABC transporter permease [Streptomyces sp. NPDC055692]|uniref:ABC transporter permease n=1 Tax=Streptomyces sp. NPDC055692 TaxID=3155683 RepID=UPI00342F7126
MTTTSAPPDSTGKAAANRPAGRGRGATAADAAVRFTLPIMVIAVVLVATVSTSGFLTLDNLRAILINTSIVGIAAVAMTPVTLSGNFFSLGVSQSTMLSAVIFLLLVGQGWTPALAIIAALLSLIIVGIVQGALVSTGLNPIVTTLAAGSVIYGLVTLASGGAVITAKGAHISGLAQGKLLGLPLPVYVFIVYTLVTWFVVDRTTVGRRIILVGTNRAAAATSGISARWITVWAFVSLSIGVGVAGVLSAAQLGQITSNDLSTLTIDAVAAILVGGTSVAGGEGSPVRTAFGALIIVILSNVMLLHGFSTGIRAAGEGVLVVAVVCLLHVLRRKVAR